MKSFRDILGITCVLSFLTLPAFGQTMIRWVDSAVGHSANVPYVEKAPDGRTTEVSGSSYLYLLSFKDRVSYPLPKTDKTPKTVKGSLEELLELPAGESLQNWDLIAFEGNSQHVAFESSIWFVSDFKGAAAGAYNTDSREKTAVVNPPTKSPLRFMSGQMRTADYFAFFHIDAKTAIWPVDVVAWILVDVPDGIDVNASNFKVLLTGAQIGKTGDGTPNPDAVGVIVHAKK